MTLPCTFVSHMQHLLGNYKIGYRRADSPASELSWTSIAGFPEGCLESLGLIELSYTIKLQNLKWFFNVEPTTTAAIAAKNKRYIRDGLGNACAYVNLQSCADLLMIAPVCVKASFIFRSTAPGTHRQCSGHQWVLQVWVLNRSTAPL